MAVYQVRVQTEVKGSKKLYQGKCFPRKGYNDKVPT